MNERTTGRTNKRDAKLDFSQYKSMPAQNDGKHIHKLDDSVFSLLLLSFSSYELGDVLDIGALSLLLQFKLCMLTHD